MTGFSTITFVSGAVERETGALQLLVETGDRGAVGLQIAAQDVSAFAAIVLTLGSLSDARRCDGATEAVPLPVHALTVGEGADGGAVLMLEVGMASLAFSLSRRHIAEIGRTLLTMSADAKSG